MKIGVSILLIFFIHFATAQKRVISYSSIDWDVTNIEASTPEELAQKLTVHYNYKYIVQSSDAQWLQLVYNDDMILRYKLNITDKKKGK